MTRETLEAQAEALEWASDADAANMGHNALIKLMQRRAMDLRAQAAALPQGEPVADMRDAYVGAREDLLDWKRRALAAEELNRKFVREVNGDTFMGEPVSPPPGLREAFEAAASYALGVISRRRDSLVAGALERNELDADEALIRKAMEGLT